METKTVQINIPVPPAPLLEQAVGYRNYHGARFLAVWWEPCGDEVMVSDGLTAFTGLWAGYLAYIRHPRIQPQLEHFNLGASDCPSDFHLVIDLTNRLALIASPAESEKLLISQWPGRATQSVPLSISADDLQTWLADLQEQLTQFPSHSELMAQIAEDEKHIAALEQWLDNLKDIETQTQGETL
ncbi:MAG: hypothetical protein WCK35_18530 [Chloroflexota bacterium]